MNFDVQNVLRLGSLAFACSSAVGIGDLSAFGSTFGSVIGPTFSPQT